MFDLSGFGSIQGHVRDLVPELGRSLALDVNPEVSRIFRIQLMLSSPLLRCATINGNSLRIPIPCENETQLPMLLYHREENLLEEAIEVQSNISIANLP